MNASEFAMENVNRIPRGVRVFSHQDLWEYPVHLPRIARMHAVMISRQTLNAPSAPPGRTDATAGATRDTGIVKWFDIRKGFGFIVDSAGRDVLVHYSAICDTGFRFLRHNESVQFTINRRDKGWFATEVVCLDESRADTMDR